jgi:hypothetical protein
MQIKYDIYLGVKDYIIKSWTVLHEQPPIKIELNLIGADYEVLKKNA